MTKKKHVVTIGGATQDIFIHYQNAQTIQIGKQERISCLLLPEGAKIEIEQLEYAIGGGATNSAVSFKRQDFQVSSFFKLGRDTQGQFIIDQLAQEGINTASVAYNEQIRTGLSCILPSPIGDSTILAYRGANATVTQQDIPTQLFKKCDQLYISSLSGPSSQLLLPIIEQAKSWAIPVATNPGSSQLAAGIDILCQALPDLNILILNADEAKLFMYSLVQTDATLQKEVAQLSLQAPEPNTPELLCTLMCHDICFNIKHYLKTILTRGPKIVVVTNGPEGVYVATKDKLYFHKSLNVEVANTVGAGDAFGSSFVGSLLLGASIEQALVRGIINAVSVISYINTKDGLLTQNELAKRFKNIGTSDVQEYSL